jgi:hypothetical protein
MVLVRLAMLTVAVGLAACGSGGGPHGDAGSDAGDVGGDAVVAGMSCQDIRVCLAVGQALEVCVGRGTAAAQATFNSLLTCLRAQPAPGCTGTDPGCTCPEECYADGLCLDETAACLDMSAATVDGVCDQYCGG